MEKVIISIHGFNSGPGDKSLELQKQFPDCEVIAPQLSYDPSKAIQTLIQIVEDNSGSELHIVGTSLGAFYTMYLSTVYGSYEDISYYLINPSFKPQETLKRYENSTVSNYKTEEQFKVTDAFFTTLQSYYQQILDSYNESCIHSSNYFLSTQDELLDFDEFKNYIKGFGVPYRIYYSEQGHRFADISIVIQKLKGNMIF